MRAAEVYPGTELRLNNRLASPCLSLLGPFSCTGCHSDENGLSPCVPLLRTNGRQRVRPLGSALNKAGHSSRRTHPGQTFPWPCGDGSVSPSAQNPATDVRATSRRKVVTRLPRAAPTEGFGLLPRCMCTCARMYLSLEKGETETEVYGRVSEDLGLEHTCTHKR